MSILHHVRVDAFCIFHDRGLVYGSDLQYVVLRDHHQRSQQQQHNNHYNNTNWPFFYYVWRASSRTDTKPLLMYLSCCARFAVLSRTPQAISQGVLAESPVESLELAGNLLDKTDFMKMEGVDAFLARRERNKNRNLQGGGMLTLSVCGLD